MRRTTSSMRRVALVIATIFGCFAAPAHALTIVRFALDEPLVEIGQSATVEIRADFDAVVLGFGIDLVFDPAVLQLIGAPTLGPDWTPLFAPDGDGLAGLGPFEGLTGTDVLLATLAVERVGLAGSPLGGSITPGDLTEGFPLLPTGFDSVVFEPVSIRAIPEPGPALLLGLGLAWLARRRRREVAIVALVGALCMPILPASALEPPCNFEDTGFEVLPRSGFNTQALGLSRDGLAVVGAGSASTDLFHPVLWDEFGELRTIQAPPGAAVVHALEVSNEVAGSPFIRVVTGTSSVTSTYVRWVAGALQDTGVPFSRRPSGLFGALYSELAVTPDGATLAGTTTSEVGAGVQAFLLDVPTNTIMPLSGIEGATRAGALSDDSRVAGGQEYQSGARCDEGELCDPVPVLWLDGTLLRLPIPAVACAPGRGGGGDVRDLSADGSVAVGRLVTCGPFPRSFAVWRDGRLTEVVAPGANDPIPLAVSPDGDVVVGTGDVLRGPAFIWTELRGFRNLETVLAEDYGFVAEMEEWNLTAATDATRLENGALVITGYMWPAARTVGAGNYTGFRVNLPCPDADSDGLCDAWERAGYIDVNGNDRRDEVGDVALPGADPLRLDIYVELDALDGYAFPEEALRDVERAFARVPNTLVGNPTGRRGIGLHLLLDERDLPATPWADRTEGPPAEYFALKSAHFGTPAERQAPEARSLKARLFRYGILGGRLVDECGTNHGSAIVGPSSDFMVTPRPRPGSDPREDFAGVLMHELGHTLGLSHAGPRPVEVVDGNFKPNYHSVMNYLWALRGKVDPGGAGQQLYAASWRLDYSRAAFSSTLNEGGVDENAGLGGTSAHLFHFLPVGPLDSEGLPRVERAGGPIDFDRDGVLEASAPANANEVLPDDPRLECSPNSLLTEVLEPTSDWDELSEGYCEGFRSIYWNIGNRSDFLAVGATPIREPTVEQLDALLLPFPVDCDGNGVSDDDELTAGSALDSDGDGLLDRCEPVEGDCDGDGAVTTTDFPAFLSSFGRSEGEAEYEACVDLDRDQDVTFVDWQLWLQAFLSSPL